MYTKHMSILLLIDNFSYKLCRYDSLPRDDFYVVTTANGIRITTIIKGNAYHILLLIVLMILYCTIIYVNVVHCRWNTFLYPI